MKYLITIVIIVFLGVNRLYAQSDFRNGYIIGSDNDTIYGMIDFRGNIANAKKCIFKRDDKSPGQIFTPDAINGYRFVNGKYYVSKSIKTDNETKQLFLEYLINGVVDFYYYRDDYGDHYLVDTGQDLRELKITETEVKIGNYIYIKKTREYIGILKYLFNKSPSISKRIENIRLDQKSLINIARDYQNEICPDQECIIYEKKIPRIKKAFGIVVGFNGLLFSQMSEYTGDQYFLNNSLSGLKLFPSIGLFYKVNPRLFNERIYFQYEGSYSRIHLSAHNSYIEPLYNMTALSNIRLTQNVYNNFVYLRYEFPKGKIRPTIQVGGFVNYFFSTDYTRYLEAKNSLGNTIYTGYENDNPFTKLDFGINIGVGLGINYLKGKELLLDLRYQRGFGWLKALNTNTFIINTAFQIWE